MMKCDVENFLSGITPIKISSFGSLTVLLHHYALQWGGQTATCYHLSRAEEQKDILPRRWKSQIMIALSFELNTETLTCAAPDQENGEQQDHREYRRASYLQALECILGLLGEVDYCMERPDIPTKKTSGVSNAAKMCSTLWL